MKFTLSVVANEFPFDNRRLATFRSKDQNICEFLDSNEYFGEKITVITEDKIRESIEYVRINRGDCDEAMSDLCKRLGL